MNPRQRRGVLLLAVAGAGMLIAFTSLSSYVESVRSQVGPLAPVLRLAKDVQPFQPVRPGDVEEVMVPQRWLPATAVSSRSELAGQVATTRLNSGSYLQRGMLGPPPSVGPGQRQATLTLGADSVPSDIGRASLIDVIATFRGTSGSSTSRIIVNDGLVLDRQPAGKSNESVRFTLALSVADSLAVSHAESQAAALRVVLVAPGSTPLPPDAREFGGAPETQTPTNPAPEQTPTTTRGPR